MKEENTIIFRAHMSSFNVAILYRFMIKRISKGYSSSETSFLMGYNSDLIKKKEDLKNIGFSLEEIHLFKNAMEERSLKTFLPGQEIQKQSSDYCLIKKTEPSQIQLKMLRIAPDNSEELIFQLQEENLAYATYELADAESLAEAKAILNVLFESRLFFSPQIPLVIYQRCRSAVGNDGISPRHVQAALLELTKKKDFPKLKRIRSNDYGCMYEKVFE
ncbi:hypothetical protein [Pedobacter caeni]|uniref:Uncharacterized protein n=1 Tax=Pedobacter caeni TaxID=288992 RepID=A0A1M4YWE0_9SPHI|nr:hypothetical protein [Pedobacter caeni]SHF10113.1 hypothetical protein SAMN04488522_10294 [Pedobacter caeni]